MLKVKKLPSLSVIIPSINRWTLRTDSENGTLGLGLRAVIETAPIDKVRAIAHRLDVERTNNQVRSPLHGVPILVKDSKWMRREERGSNTNMSRLRHRYGTRHEYHCWIICIT